MLYYGQLGTYERSHGVYGDHRKRVSTRSRHHLWTQDKGFHLTVLCRVPRREPWPLSYAVCNVNINLFTWRRNRNLFEGRECFRSNVCKSYRHSSLDDFNLIIDSGGSSRYCYLISFCTVNSFDIRQLVTNEHYWLYPVRNILNLGVYCVYCIKIF